MAVNIEIKQVSRDISIQKIAVLNGLKYGVLDNNYTLDQNKIGEHTILYNPDYIARGIEIWQEDHNIYLNLSLPTTSREIQLFYQLTENICQVCDYEDIYRDEKLISINDIFSFIELDEEASLNAILNLEQQLLSKEMKSFFVFGALNPITLGEQECKEIQGTLEGFEQLLNRLQQLDVFYANPILYRRKDSSVFGVYFINKDTLSVIPLKPGLPFYQNLKVDDYYVMIPDRNTVLYEDFLTHVDKIDTYDQNHVIISLKQDVIDYLVENYTIDVVSNQKTSHNIMN